MFQNGQTLILVLVGLILLPLVVATATIISILLAMIIGILIVALIITGGKSIHAVSDTKHGLRINFRIVSK